MKRTLSLLLSILFLINPLNGCGRSPSVSELDADFDGPLNTARIPPEGSAGYAGMAPPRAVNEEFRETRTYDPRTGVYTVHEIFTRDGEIEFENKTVNVLTYEGYEEGRRLVRAFADLEKKLRSAPSAKPNVPKGPAESRVPVKGETPGSRGAATAVPVGGINEDGSIDPPAVDQRNGKEPYQRVYDNEDELRQDVERSRSDIEGKMSAALRDSEASHAALKLEVAQAIKGFNQQVDRLASKLPKGIEAPPRNDRFATPAGTRERNLLEKTAEYADFVESELRANSDEYQDQRFELLGAGRSAISVADQHYSRGDVEGGDTAIAIAQTALDVGLGMIPFVGWGKDCYEAVTGRSLVSGEKLDHVGRLFAVAGMFSAGIGSKFGKFRHAVDVVDELVGDSRAFRQFLGSDKARPIFDQVGNGLRFGLKGSSELRSFSSITISPSRVTHILHGDSHAGGHLFPGGEGKSSFPKEWSGEKIIHEVTEVIRDPAVEWKPANAPRGATARFQAKVVRDEVEILVVIEPLGEGVITAYPLKGPGVLRNPKRK